MVRQASISMTLKKHASQRSVGKTQLRFIASLSSCFLLIHVPSRLLSLCNITTTITTAGSGRSLRTNDSIRLGRGLSLRSAFSGSVVDDDDEMKDQDTAVSFPEDISVETPPVVTMKRQKTVSTLVSDGLSSELAAELLKKFGR